MIISVIDAEYISNYKVKLDFDNGESGIIDLRETIYNDHRKIFKPLQNMEFFKSFKLDSWTLTWPNEADFSPEFLYELHLKNKEKIRTVL